MGNAEAESAVSDFKLTVLYNALSEYIKELFREKNLESLGYALEDKPKPFDDRGRKLEVVHTDKTYLLYIETYHYRDEVFIVLHSWTEFSKEFVTPGFYLKKTGGCIEVVDEEYRREIKRAFEFVGRVK